LLTVLSTTLLERAFGLPAFSRRVLKCQMLSAVSRLNNGLASSGNDY
jgi:hypothetical protein